MIYYTADLHFGCQNTFEGRTLDTDDLIIKRWNQKVNNGDTVYILGDVGREGKNEENEYLCQCLSVLKGRKVLIQGKTFFTFGGAASHDIKDGILEMSDERIRYWNLLGKEYRVNHLTWWEREMASREEMDEGLHNLERVGNKVDFILTHCINTSTAALMSSGRYKPDSMTEYLEKIYGTVEWKKWLFGHYHDNRAMTNNQLLLYDQIIQIA